jgi:hypothetical protein
MRGSSLNRYDDASPALQFADPVAEHWNLLSFPYGASMLMILDQETADPS